MTTSDSVYIGLDTTAGRRPATIAILDHRLQVYVENAALDRALELIAAYPYAVCGVDAPIETSRSLLADPATRQRFGLDPTHTNYSTYRIGEYELRRRGIHSYKTPANRADAPGWMQVSWRLYDRLREIGFVAFPQTGPRVMFETYPHAAYTVLLQKRPYPKNSLEGRAQRQIVLYREGINVTDPMQIFEEWTRHRFLVGDLPMDRLLEHDALDALIAAYTAFLLHREPQNTTALGDMLDGQIVLPVPARDLRDLYE